jgi:hypothetical protein
MNEEEENDIENTEENYFENNSIKLKLNFY